MGVAHKEDEDAARGAADRRREGKSCAEGRGGQAGLVGEELLGVHDAEAEHAANDANVEDLDDVQLPEVVAETEEGVVAGADP
jgi:hypothetical protein